MSTGVGDTSSGGSDSLGVEPRMCGSLLPCLYTFTDVESQHQISVIQQFVSELFHYRHDKTEFNYGNTENTYAKFHIVGLPFHEMFSFTNLISLITSNLNASKHHTPYSPGN
jgi:hypothetical protein